MAGHDQLDSTMFWTGALIALTPVVIGLVVLGVVFYHRRKRSSPPEPR
jgi:heme/copper-type cytochrome/quinol oxidase subunit 2